MKPEPQKQQSGDVQRGLVCARCGCADFRVLYTRAAWGNRIIRRRECRHCGKRIITYERFWAGPTKSGVFR